MSHTKVLQFEESDKIGGVISVDTSKVWVSIVDPDLLSQVSVGALVAIQGSKVGEFLIGILDRVNRTIRQSLKFDEESEDGDVPAEEVPDDIIRLVLVGTFLEFDGGKRDVFKRGADSYPQIDRPCFSLAGSNLQRLMSLMGGSLPTEERLSLGRFVSDQTAEAIASGDKFFQRHAAILGSTGSGKSWAVASILERAHQLKHSNLIVLDMHGEYSPLYSGPDAYATGYRIAGPGDLEHPASDALFLPFWLLSREEMLSMILDRSDSNAPNQASRFTLHVRELKEDTLKEANQSEVLKTFTVDSPVPYILADLLVRLEKDNTEKGVGVNGREVKGDWEGKLTRFLARLRAKVDDRRYGFMFQPPSMASEYYWLAEQVSKLLSSDLSEPGIKIIDFSEVPSDVLPVVAAVLVRLLYDVQFWMKPDERTPFAVVCDEAHLYLPVQDDADAAQKQALGAFERVAKEGRKYGVSLLVVSQRPSDVSRTILSQCNNFLTLRLTNDRDQAVVRRLVPDSMGGLVDILPLLDTGEALVLGDSVLLPTRIRLAKPRVPPASATRAFWRDWGSDAPDPLRISSAVEALRAQTRVTPKKK